MQDEYLNQFESHLEQRFATVAEKVPVIAFWWNNTFSIDESRFLISSTPSDVKRRVTALWRTDFSIRASGVASATIFPLAIMIALWQIASTSSKICVDRIIVLSCPCGTEPAQESTKNIFVSPAWNLSQSNGDCLGILCRKWGESNGQGTAEDPRQNVFLLSFQPLQSVLEEDIE